jgi:hypothetical protein
VPITLDVVDSKRFVYARATGVLTLADNLSAFYALSVDPRFEFGFSQLCDFRGITEARLGESELREFVTLEQSSLDLLSGARIALVAPEAFSFGLARMWEILADGMPFETHVFRSLPEAVAWLGLSESDLPPSCPP